MSFSVSLRNPTLVGTATLLIFLLALLVAPRVLNEPSKSARAASPQRLFSVSSLADGFKISKADTVAMGPNEVLELTLTNDYAKSITAFAVTGAGNLKYDFLQGDSASETKILPGSTYVLRLPIVDSQSTVVVIKTVVFDDLTSEGDQMVANEILDIRLGAQIQMERINPMVQMLGFGKHASISAELQSVREDINALPEDIVSGQSLHVRMGLIYAKQSAITRISKFEELYAASDLSSRGRELSQLKQNFQILRDRLHPSN